MVDFFLIQTKTQNENETQNIVKEKNNEFADIFTLASFNEYKRENLGKSIDFWSFFFIQFNLMKENLTRRNIYIKRGKN